MSSASAMAMFLFAESSIHAGTGSTLSHVDLPIQREIHTAHPIIYASGWKGALRELFEKLWKTDPKKIEILFGPEGDKGDYGGMGIFKEVRVALFPVRSLIGTFAWITCPLVIRRLQRDVVAMLPMLADQTQAKKMAEDFGDIPEMKPGEALFCGTNGLLVNGEVAVFEDYEYGWPHDEDSEEQTKRRAAANKYATSLAGWFGENVLPGNDNTYQWWREKMKKDIVVVGDDEFTHFVRMHTEVQPHVAIGPNGVVERSGPWTEEALPPDTILYSCLAVPALPAALSSAFGEDGPVKEVAGQLAKVQRFQIAGDRSLGKGFVHVSCLA